MLKRKYNALKRRYLKKKSLLSNRMKKKPITKEMLVADLKKIGLKLGQTVLVHSSLSKIGYVEGGADTVIDALIECVGENGTLMIPTFSFKGTVLNTCQDPKYIFDIKETPSALGTIPNTFLKRSNIIRSIHPTHSIAAIGKEAKSVTSTHHLGDQTYGSNSPWAKLIERDGYIMGIGISLGPHTIYHYVEDIMGSRFPIKVNVDQKYSIICKVPNEPDLKVIVQPLDPEIAKTRIDKEGSQFIRDYFWAIYTKTKILTVEKIGDSISWFANARNFCILLEKLALMGITIYSTQQELVERNLYPIDLIKDRILGDSK